MMTFSDIFKSSFLENVTTFSIIDTLIGMLFAVIIGLLLSGPRTTGDGYYESCILAVEGNQIELTV